MQIVPFEKQYFKRCAKILSACMENPERQLSEYLESPNAKVIAAKEKEDIIAVCLLLITPDSADLVDIATDEKYRKTGAALALLNKSAQICKSLGIKNILLEVRKSNTPAINLYEKFGFVQIYVRKNYYSNPVEDALIYEYTCD